MGKILEIHALHSFPPSLINRGRDGEPKSCTFGGVNRARISSQCLKRAVRFSETSGGGKNEVRTKFFIEEVDRARAALGYDSSIAPAVGILLEMTGISKKNDEKNSTLMFVSCEEITEVAELVWANLAVINECAAKLVKKAEKDEKDTKKSKSKQATNGSEEGGSAKKSETTLSAAEKEIVDKFKRIVSGTSSSVSVAMHGRMIAESGGSGGMVTDAACQVAHALSTHSLDTEVDFFTAVDDRAGLGAGHMQEAEFTSACFYKFASIDMEQLRHNMKDPNQAATAAANWARSFAFIIPEGKINSHAHSTAPSMIVIAVRENSCLSMANAFEDPVSSYKERGYIAESVQRFAEHWSAIERSGAIKAPAEGCLFVWSPLKDQLFHEENSAFKRTFSTACAEDINDICRDLAVALS